MSTVIENKAQQKQFLVNFNGGKSRKLQNIITKKNATLISAFVWGKRKFRLYYILRGFNLWWDTNMTILDKKKYEYDDIDI